MLRFYRSVLLSVVSFLVVARECSAQPSIIVEYDASNGPLVSEMQRTSVDFADSDLRLVTWTEGNSERWQFIQGSWRLPVNSRESDLQRENAEVSRSYSGHVAADLNTVQSSTTVLPQLRSGTVTRGVGDLFVPYEGALICNPKITIRRESADDKNSLQQATATIFRDGEALLRVPFSVGSTTVHWTEIADLPPSLSTGLSPGRYELELQPTATGMQRVSFEVVDSSTYRQLVTHANALQKLLPDSSPVPTQVAVEQFLSRQPAMLADALDWLEGYPAEKYTTHLDHLQAYVWQRLKDVGQEPKVRRASGPATGDSEIDSVRELIAAHDWKRALDDLKLIEEDSEPDDSRRHLLVHLYRGVISSESGASGDANARKSFDRAVELLDRQGVLPEDRFRVRFNYANHLIGRVTDRFHNQSFQMAARVPHPISTSLQDWIQANQQLKASNDSALTKEDKETVSLNSARLYLLLADIVSSLAEPPEQAASMVAGIRSQANSILKELTDLGRNVGDPRVRAVATEMLGQSEYRHGNLEAAKEAAQLARQQFTQLGDLVGIESAERLLGLISLSESNANSEVDALQHLQVSEQLGNLLRDRYLMETSGQSIAGFMARRYYVNELIVDLLANRGEAKKALEHAELAKARAYTDMLAASGKSLKASQDFSVETALNGWPNGVVVLEYFLTANNCWLFMISTGGDVNVRRLCTSAGKAIAPQDLIRMVGNTREMLNNYKYQWQDEAFVRRFNDAWQHQLQNLCEILLPSELRVSLAKYERVIIVPHHILHYFPFAALVTQVDMDADANHMALPRFLLDQQFAISYAPSLASWRFLDKYEPTPVRRVGIVADTRPESKLREVATEVHAIRQAFGDQLLAVHEGRAASVGNATDVLRDADLAFFGCHGQNVWDAPLEGHLLLSDGNLSAQTLLNSEVKAALVILSACHSGLADRSPLPGDDLFGLERVLLSRGARCVVSGNWLVDDLRGARITSALVKNVAHEIAADQALADAQRTVVDKYRTSTDERLRFFSHPHFWAVYKLSGVFAGSESSLNLQSTSHSKHVEVTNADSKIVPTETVVSRGETSTTHPVTESQTQKGTVLIRNAANGYAIYFEIDDIRSELSSGASRWFEIKESQSNLKVIGGKQNAETSGQSTGGGFTTRLTTRHTYDLVTEISPSTVSKLGGLRVVVRDLGKSVGDKDEARVWIENPHSYPIQYRLNGKNFMVEPRQLLSHLSNYSTGSTIEFDASLEKGDQRKGYRLLAGSRNYFTQVENGLDLHRR